MPPHEIADEMIKDYEGYYVPTEVDGYKCVDEYVEHDYS